jgi:hypothetical protein
LYITSWYASNSKAAYVCCSYLTANPGDQARFPKFAEVPLGDLRANADFNAQTIVIVKALSAIVATLGDVQKGAELLRQRVRTHYKRNITMAQFEVGNQLLSKHHDL